jgi:hypothetical protein
VSRDSIRAGMLTDSAIWQAANSSGSRTSISKYGCKGKAIHTVFHVTLSREIMKFNQYLVLCSANELTGLARRTNWSPRWQRSFAVLFRDAVHPAAVAVLNKQSIQL